MAANNNEKIFNNDAALNEHAKNFLRLFLECNHEVDQDILLQNASSNLLFSGPTFKVNISKEAAGQLSKLIERAAKLLGSVAAHESAIRKIAVQYGIQYFKEQQQDDIGGAAKRLIGKIFNEAHVSHEILFPNRLYQIDPQIRRITVGPVTALFSEDFIAKKNAECPDDFLELKVGLEDEEGRGLQFDETRNKSFYTIPKHCWVVEVEAIAENAEEEARWLIDVAISYLRLRHRQWTLLPPELGDYEPDPIRVTHSSSDTHRFNESFMALPTITNTPWYEIDLEVSHTTADPTFISKANLIFSQPQKNLATRVSQGLGWLTRGRRAKDRSERLLYFFTAIEALLSSDDKSSPIVQTISRHAAVLLSKNNSERAEIAKLIRDLYAYRSSVVHAGTRSVLWQHANKAQRIAELIFYNVLELSDLSVPHQDFCKELAECSYGLLWPKVPDKAAE